MAPSAPRPQCPPGGRGSRWPPRPGASSLARPDLGPVAAQLAVRVEHPATRTGRPGKATAGTVPCASHRQWQAGSGGLACGRGYRRPHARPAASGVTGQSRWEHRRHRGTTATPAGTREAPASLMPTAGIMMLIGPGRASRVWPGMTASSEHWILIMWYCTIRGAQRRDATRRSAQTVSAGVQEPFAQPKIRVIGRSARSFDWAYFKPSAEWSVAGWSWPSTR
jgi:hypothetical protein